MSTRQLMISSRTMQPGKWNAVHAGHLINVTTTEFAGANFIDDECADTTNDLSAAGDAPALIGFFGRTTNLPLMSTSGRWKCHGWKYESTRSSQVATASTTPSRLTNTCQKQPGSSFSTNTGTVSSYRFDESPCSLHNVRREVYFLLWIPSRQLGV
jgi:hypothetical protein